MDGITLFGSLIFTLFIYGAFPIAFSFFRVKPISKKRYKEMCWGVNLLVVLFDLLLTAFALDQGVKSVGRVFAPYFLFTAFFTSIGRESMEKKGVISSDSDSCVEPKANENSLLKSDIADEKFENYLLMYKNYSDKELGRIIKGNYTDIAKLAAKKLLDQRDTPSYVSAKQTNLKEKNEAVKDSGLEFLTENLIHNPIDEHCDDEHGNDKLSRSNMPIVKYCRKCGASLKAESKFCACCGTEVMIGDSNEKMP